MKGDAKRLVDPNWLREFDSEMKRLFAIDHSEAGMGSKELSRYSDMPPREAALCFGEDYDLQRTDIDWVS